VVEGEMILGGAVNVAGTAILSGSERIVGSARIG
jgi:hypothetical protein